MISGGTTAPFPSVAREQTASCQSIVQPRAHSAAFAPERQRKGAFWTGMVVLMILHLSQFAAIFTEHLDHWVLSGTSMIVIRALSERMPGGSTGVWIECGLVFLMFYRLAESHFIRVESKPGDDMRVALIQRPIGAAAEEGAYAR